MVAAKWHKMNVMATYSLMGSTSPREVNSNSSTPANFTYYIFHKCKDCYFLTSTFASSKYNNVFNAI